MLPLRSPEFEEIFRRTCGKAALLFGTAARVLIGSYPAAGMEETAVRSLVDQNLLCCVNGALSDRWFEIAAANGKQPERLETTWGRPILPEQLRAALRQKTYEAVSLAMIETTTGVENPLPELAAVVAETSPDTLILVDAAAAVGGLPVEMDAWGLDLVLTGSPMCLALPPGLSLAGVSDRALKKAESVPNRGRMTDLLRMEQHRLKDSTPVMPAMPLIFALDVQLDRILAEGLENRFARHIELNARVQAWAEAHDLPPFAEAGYRARTLNVLQNTRGWDIAAVNKTLLQRGMRIGGGYGTLKDKTFRVAVMGELQSADVDLLLEALEELLQQP